MPRQFSNQLKRKWQAIAQGATLTFDGKDFAFRDRFGRLMGEAEIEAFRETSWRWSIDFKVVLRHPLLSDIEKISHTEYLTGQAVKLEWHYEEMMRLIQEAVEENPTYEAVNTIYKAKAIGR